MAESKDETEKLLEAMPEFLKSLLPEVELITGKKIRLPITAKDIASAVSKLRRLSAMNVELQEIQRMPSTQENIVKAYQLINKMVRLAIRGIPRQDEPLQYLMQQARAFCEEPRGLRFPAGLDYANKHAGLREFARQLVITIDEHTVDEFFQQSVSGRHLTPQLQRAVGNMMLPRVLKTPPSRVSSRSAERLKNGLREVLGDWEALVNLVYGAAKLLEQKPKTWSEIRLVALHDKVHAILADKRLIALAKEDWVTVRNSLDHGGAFFNPSEKIIEFPDRHKHVSWKFEQATREGQDIFLANLAMFGLNNIVLGERMLLLEPAIAAMREGKTV